MNRALDVVSVNGTPTCRSVVNGTDPSCIPFDAFRAGSGSNALTNYLFSSGATASGGRSPSCSTRSRW